MYDLFPEEPIEPEAADTEEELVVAARPRRINRVAIAALIAVPAIAIGVAVGNNSSGDSVKLSASSSARTTIAAGANSGNGTARNPTITGLQPAGGGDDGGGDGGGGFGRRGPNGGKITAVDANTITVQRTGGNGGAGRTTTLITDAKTKYSLTVALKATDLKSGDSVSVLGQRDTNTTAVAFSVVVNPPAGGALTGPQGDEDGDHAPINGSIESISGNTMNVKTSTGMVAVTLQAGTSITALQAATAAEVKIGLYVTSAVSATVNGPASQITLSTTPAVVGGFGPGGGGFAPGGANTTTTLQSN